MAPALVIRAVHFGRGWGLVGVCPGPSNASLSYAGPDGVLFLMAMLAGIVMAETLRKWLDTSRRLA
ncbi:MAG: DUF6691 family protein [Paracoccaceae bacterium]|nr:DUF6691 family protein [Paracoccaceae bacterium]